MESSWISRRNVRVVAVELTELREEELELLVGSVSEASVKWKEKSADWETARWGSAKISRVAERSETAS